jgi:hypothetical protein
MRRFIVPMALVGCLVAASMVVAEEMKMDKAKPMAKSHMTHYLIAVPHTPEECATTIGDYESAKAISKFDFGCESGDHTAYAIVSAKSAEDAKMMVPEKERDKAKVTELHKFTPEELKQMHASMMKQ